MINLYNPNDNGPILILGLLSLINELLGKSKITLDEWLKLSEMAKSSDKDIYNLAIQIIKTK